MNVAGMPGFIMRNPPASTEAIAHASRAFAEKLPEEYAAFLAQANGIVADQFVLYSCEELIERNATLEVNLYAP
jgi:hypothetical protein